MVLATFFFLVIDWAIIGCIVDTLYRAQSYMFGSDADVATVAKKVAFDMLVWNPFAGVWITMLPFHWRSCEFSCTRFWDSVSPKFLLVTASATLVTTWAIWLPSVIVVYSLPSDLQIPVFNFILCFSNLILMFVTRDLAKKPESETEAVEEKDLEMQPLLP